MKTEDFEIKYKDKGGMNKLRLLRVMQFSRSYIAKYFGVTNSAVYQWDFMFPHTEDDLSEGMILDNMVDFARNHNIYEFKFAFKRGKNYPKGLERVKREVYGQ